MESHYKLTSEMAMHVISTSTQDGTRCLHHSWSELELINSCNYCRVIWHSNDHLMYPSLVKTKARWVLFWFVWLFAPVSKGLNMWWPETDQQHSSSIHKSISWPTALVASKTLSLERKFPHEPVVALQRTSHSEKLIPRMGYQSMCRISGGEVTANGIKSSELH